MSLDEAYLNITAYLCSSQATIDPSYNTTSSSSSSCKSPDQVVEEIRQLIFTTTGLTASAGVAPNRFLAKVCSDMNKPNGQMRIPADTEAIATFLHDLRIRKVPGIGRVMEKILNGLEIDTCGDMKSQLVLLYKLFSETSFNFLLYTALGLGETSLKSTSSELQLDRKSISVERTFNTMSRYGEMQEKLNELSELLATDLDELDLKGRSVTLKLKMASFEIISRSKSSTQYISTASELFSVAKSLLHAEFSSRSTHGLDAGLKIRLMGLRLSDLKSSSKESSSSAGIARFFIKSGEVGGGGEDGHVAAAAKRNTSGIKMEVFHCFNCPETLFDVSDQEINDHIDICVARSQPVR